MGTTIALATREFADAARQRMSFAFKCNAVFLNMDTVIISLLDDIFYGECRNSQETAMEAVMYSGGVVTMPRDTAKDFVELCRDNLLMQLRYAKVDISVGVEYRVVRNIDDNLFIEVTPPRPASEPSITDLIKKEVSEAEENGDYIPEAIRRLAGV